MSCEELDELAGALALGAALPGETEAARAHLAACRRGHSDLQDFMAIAALLPEARQPAPPDPALRTRVLAVARAERIPPSPVPPRPAGPSAPQPARWKTSRAPLFATVAAVLLIMALGLGRELMLLRDELGEQRAQLALQQEALAALAAGGEFVAFHGGPAAGASHGGIVRPPEGKPVLLLAGMMPPAQGVYQLWMIHDGQHQDMGTFLPGADGRYTVVLPDISAAQELTVTTEPHHVPQPTTEPILVATLDGEVAAVSASG